MYITLKPNKLSTLAPKAITAFVRSTYDAKKALMILSKKGHKPIKISSLAVTPNGIWIVTSKRAYAHHSTSIGFIINRLEDKGYKLLNPKDLQGKEGD